MPRDYGGIYKKPLKVRQLRELLILSTDLKDEDVIEELVVDDKHTLPGEGPWSWYLRVED